MPAKKSTGKKAKREPLKERKATALAMQEALGHCWSMDTLDRYRVQKIANLCLVGVGMEPISYAEDD